MNYLPRMLQKLKKMRYFRNFCYLLSKNLRLAQNLPNEVFVYKSDFKVDIPHTETLRISLLVAVASSITLYGPLRKIDDDSAVNDPLIWIKLCSQLSFYNHTMHNCGNLGLK